MTIPHIKHVLRWIGLAFAALGALVILGIIALAVWAVTYDGHTKAGREFEPKIKALLAHDEFPVALHDLTDFPWTTVCWLGPYAIGPFAPHFGSDRAAMDAMPWVSHDGRWGLVFVDNAGTVTLVSVKRELIDILNIELPGPCLCGDVKLSRKDATTFKAEGDVCEVPPPAVRP